MHTDALAEALRAYLTAAKSAARTLARQRDRAAVRALGKSSAAAARALRGLKGDRHKSHPWTAEDEAKHPRAAHGRFGDKPGEHSDASTDASRKWSSGSGLAAIRAIVEAHPFPGPIPLSPPGTGSPALRRQNPALAEADRREQEHMAKFRRATVAEIIERMLTGKPDRPIPLAGADEPQGKRVARFNRALDRVEECYGDASFLRALNERQPMSASHPRFEEALADAQAVAQQRLQAAIGNCQEHIERLPEHLRERARNKLLRTAILQEQPAEFRHPAKSPPAPRDLETDPLRAGAKRYYATPDAASAAQAPAAFDHWRHYAAGVEAIRRESAGQR